MYKQSPHPGFSAYQRQTHLDIKPCSSKMAAPWPSPAKLATVEAAACVLCSYCVYNYCIMKAMLYLQH